jgi:hypothetical protein
MLVGAGFTFEFYRLHIVQIFMEKKFSAKFQDYAQDYCEGSSLEISVLEVIVYNS